MEPLDGFLSAEDRFLTRHQVGDELTARDFRDLNVWGVQTNSGGWSVRVARISIRCATFNCDRTLAVRLEDGQLAEIGCLGQCARKLTMGAEQVQIAEDETA